MWIAKEDSVRNAIKKNIEIFNEEWVKLRLAEESTNFENKAADRIRATELVGKTMAMFVEKVENDVKNWWNFDK